MFDFPFNSSRAAIKNGIQDDWSKRPESLQLLGKLKLILNMFALNFALIFGVMKTMSASAQVENTARYINTETDPNSSFDHLNADQTQNLPVMRMLYLTPLEVSDDDKLRSTVLSEFSHQRESRTIVFEVRLVALIPELKFHTMRYYGVLASSSPHRRFLPDKPTSLIDTEHGADL